MQIPALILAIAIAGTLSVLVFRYARAYISIARLLTFAVAAALGWLIVLSASTLPNIWWREPLQRLSAAIVGVCWFVLIRDAVRARRATAEVDDRRYR